ncbi:PAS and helix-turn-helix domain-containing protein [Agrobacterium sp. LAD9]|uniref:PAS and helix-turn-helix domain-containing protein n=1 Tax=Agrobacterium sp. LAD9 TaxID=2055153 RepID=UPI000D1D8AA1|nr:PAS and helix-turn-helix domain-containing protein [Agrobacterium sp. LAD9]
MTPKSNDIRFPLAAIPIPLVFATHRIIRDCNAEFASLFGCAREELLDESFARLYPKLSDFVRTGHMWQAHLRGGQVYYDERIMTAIDGTRFWCRVRGRRHHAENPFAEALYCFERLTRPVARQRITLTDRQRQVVALVAQGKNNAAIAAELSLSKRTIESHRARLMQAAGLRNAAELVAWFSNEDRG